MRFLLSRRWVLFALVIVLAGWGAWMLGQWQFDRLDQRKHDNAIQTTNLNSPPVPVDEVLSTSSAPAESQEWKPVTIHGTWDDERSIVVKYRTRDGAAGVDVVTPLVTDTGAAVLVDRGWLGTANTGGDRPKLPAATDGKVTVTGHVRRDATGSSTEVSDLATRAISSKQIGSVLPYEVYRGFVELTDEAPAPATPLAAIEVPDQTSNGPHFFYGLQWWFFGVLAILGFGYLAYDEWRRSRRTPDSQAAEHAPVDRHHRAGHEA